MVAKLIGCINYGDVGGGGVIGGSSLGECELLCHLSKRIWVDWVILVLWVSENATCTHFLKGTSVPKLETPKQVQWENQCI